MKIGNWEFNRPVLLVIDMQNDFCHPEGWAATHGGNVEFTNAVIPKVKELVNLARDRKIPIIHTQIALTEETGGWFFELRPIYKNGGIRKGTWGADFVDELKPQPGEYVVEKRRFSAFIGTDLDIILRGLKADFLFVSGVATHLCVESTIRDAAQRDYPLALVRDCTASYSLELQKGTERAVEAGFGKVIDLEEVKRLFKS